MVKYRINNERQPKRLEGGDFVKNGESVWKIYNISTSSKQGAHMVAELLDNEFAITQTRRIMAEHGKSKHSVFYK